MFPLNREERTGELQRHCEGVYLDLEETDEKQKERVQRYENLGNEQFSQERIAEISVELVLQARARLCDGNVNGPKRQNCERNAEATTVGKSL